MRISYILFTSLIWLSQNIIRDLPYNIYHIEDMNQYENKYLPEGNKFYIRFPSNLNDDIKFHLTIPKNTTLFPVYISEFSQLPSNQEIINAEFKNEIDLKNREDLDYSIYTFDIKKSDSFKVLYFQNNEILNYISFYASSKTSTFNSGSIIDLNIGDRKEFFSFPGGTSYYFRVASSSSSEKVLITTDVPGGYDPDYQVDIKFFSYRPSDDEVTNVDYSWERNLNPKIRYNYYEIREYELVPSNKFKYIAIHIYNSNNVLNFTIKVNLINELKAWQIMLIVISGIVFLVLLVLCLRTETGRAACYCLLCIALCASSMAVNAQSK